MTALFGRHGTQHPRAPRAVQPADRDSLRVASATLCLVSELVLVFVPTSREELVELSAGKPLTCPRSGYCATAELKDTFGLDDEEEAEFAALQVASVACLTRQGERVVVTAKLPKSEVRPGADVPNGEVQVCRLVLADVEAVFTDENPQVAQAAARVVAGRDLDAAWSAPEVQHVLNEHDLLWHSVAELASLTGRG